MDDWKPLRTWLGKRESGKEGPAAYGVTNQFDFLGKYQLGEGMLHDLGYYNDTAYYPGGDKPKNTWNGTWVGKDGIVDNLDRNKFLQNVNNVQETVIKEEFHLNWKQILKEVPDASQRDTQSALLAGAHLCGPWAVIDYLKTGKVAQDENGTRLTQYMNEARHVK